MMAKVPAEPNITYSWNRTLHQRSWDILKSKDGTQWNVISTFQRTGMKKPIEDTFNMEVLSDKPSPKNILYYYDVPGATFLDFLPCKVGDYSYREVVFTYTLTIKNGSAPPVSASIDVGQSILSQRSSIGLASSNWKYIYNKVATTNTPNCAIDQAKVSQIVGNDGLKIFITPDANNDR